MSWETLNTIAQVAGVILLAITFGIGAFTVYSQLRVNKAQKEEIRQKDERLALELKEKDLQIAAADKKAADANAVAAKANESAAMLNERAQKLEGENIKLRTDLENATAEARKKQTELTLEQQKMAKEQQKTAEAQMEAAQTLLHSQFNLQQMRSWLMPRRLVSGQNREKFMAALKDKPVLTVDIVWQADMFIGEPEQFAEDVKEALKEAGWAVKGPKGVLVAGDPDPLNVKAVEGIRILVRNPDEPTLSESALQWAFLQSGFNANFLL